MQDRLHQPASMGLFLPMREWYSLGPYVEKRALAAAAEIELVGVLAVSQLQNTRRRGCQQCSYSKKGRAVSSARCNQEACVIEIFD
jgi:hypothetical protein